MESGGSAALLVQTGYYALSKIMQYEKFKEQAIMRLINEAMIQPGGLRSNNPEGTGENVDIYV